MLDQGEAEAQVLLGSMYEQGWGVPQDYGIALSWLRKAAEQGSAKGQALLGGMYVMGHGVPQDFVIGHMWLNLATAAGGKYVAETAEFRDRVAKEMTPAQIAEAQKLARERCTAARF